MQYVFLSNKSGSKTLAGTTQHRDENRLGEPSFESHPHMEYWSRVHSSQPYGLSFIVPILLGHDTDETA